MAFDTKRQFLVADIGGTNTRVALSSGPKIRTETVRRFKNAEHDGLAQALSVYVQQETPGNIDGACVAVAGPVRDGKAELTNRNWYIDADTVAAPTGAGHVAVVNDLEAQGYALDGLADDSLDQILAGAAKPLSSDRLVIGVGTGFNCAPVYTTDHGRWVSPAEAGHANLPVQTDEDLELLAFIQASQGFAAVEDVLSGRGLERIYRFLAQRDGSDRTLSAADIMAAFKASDDPLASHTVRTFIRVLGTVAGNLALVHLPYGGVFLVGGVMQAMAPYLKSQGFLDAFADKGRFSEFMTDFPIAVVKDDYAALSGCAARLDAGFRSISA